MELAVVNTQLSLVAYAPKTGNIIWTSSLPDIYLKSVPSVSVDGQLIYVCTNGAVVALHSANGTQVWSFEQFGYLGGTVALGMVSTASGDKPTTATKHEWMYFTNMFGTLTAVDTVTREQMWQHASNETMGWLSTNMAFDQEGGSLYLTTDKVPNVTFP